MASTLALTIEQLPFLTRAQALEEGEYDPAFWPYLLDIMHHPNPAVAVDNEMKKAVMNALDPSVYADAGGHWPMLKRKIVETHRAIAGHLQSGALHGFALSAYVIDPATGVMTQTPDTPAVPSAAQPSGGTDIWSTLGKAFTAIAPAVGSIFSSKIAAGATTSVAKTAAGVATAQLTAQQQLAAQQALALAQQKGGTSGASIILYVLLGLLGVGGLVLLMGKMKG